MKPLREYQNDPDPNDFGTRTDADGAAEDSTIPDPVSVIIEQLRALQLLLAQYVDTYRDSSRFHVRQLSLRIVSALVLFIIGGAFLAAFTVHLVTGIVAGISAAFGISLWLSQLICGAIVLTLVGAVLFAVPRMVNKRSLRALTHKYALRNHHSTEPSGRHRAAAEPAHYRQNVQ